MQSIVRRLGEIYAAHGRELYLVGGSIRDELLGRPSEDVDCTTDALPEETRRLAALAGADTIYTVGEKFGTIGLVFGDLKVEITTFRTERYQPKSRKPEVAFGTSLVEDLARRDFTINAIAQDLTTGRLIDPFGGLYDLQARLIRAVGVPEERFKEDPLRLLRAVRFAAQLQFQIEPRTREAIRCCATLLNDISRERILDEMNRMLLAPRPSVGLRLMVDLGLMEHCLPEVSALQTVNQGRRAKNVLAHTLLVVDRTPPILPLRWAALLHDVGKPATVVEENGEVHFPGHESVGEEMSRQILTRLRMDRHTAERIARLVGLHMRVNQYEPEWTDSAVRRLVRAAGEDIWHLLDLSTADVTSYRREKVAAAIERVQELRRRIERLLAEEDLAAIKSPLNGNELMALFKRPPGPWIGSVKDYLLDQVLEGKLAPDDKQRAAELAQEFLSAAPAG